MTGPFRRSAAKWCFTEGLWMNPKGVETAAPEQTPYSDAHIAAYPVEYIAGIDLYNAGEFHAAQVDKLT